MNDPSHPEDGQLREWPAADSVRSISCPDGDGVSRACTFQEILPKRLVSFRAELSLIWRGPGAWLVGGIGMLARLDDQMVSVPWPPPGWPQALI